MVKLVGTAVIVNNSTGWYSASYSPANSTHKLQQPMSSGDLFDANWISSTRAATKNRIAEFLNNASAKNQAEYDAKKASEVNEAIGGPDDPVACNQPGSEDKSKFRIKLPRFSITKTQKPITKTDIIRKITQADGFGPIQINIPGNRSATFSIFSDMASQADAFSLIDQNGIQLNPGIPFGNINIPFAQNITKQQLTLIVTPFVPIGSTMNIARANDVYSVYVSKTYITSQFTGFKFSFDGWR